MKIVLTAVGILFSCILINAQNSEIVWYEGFEGDWTQSWYAESGTWDVGMPTSGPGTVHDGTQCAATVLNGNYNYYVDSRLVQISSFIVPAASENPRLRFFHWFRFQPADDDWGKVQLKVSGSTEWVDISERYDDYSSLWTETSIDLGAYAGETVQIAFFFHSDGSHEHPGWYIDDVSLVAGSYVFNNPEGWEDGIGDWYAETGLWDFGTPTSGPKSAHTGENCIATNVNGNYDYYADARFVSPTITLPAASENPRLRFFHWFRFQPADDDWGKVQLKVSGSTEWVDIGERYDDYSSLWTETSIELGAYAGETVQIAFFFHSDGSHEHPGWYIDDVSLVTGSYVFNNPEGWEDGIGDWYAETGLWDFGTPTSGPESAHTGQNCIATNVNGNYDYYADARFVSPNITLPAASENPRLRFFHWFRFQPADDDWGKVQLKVSGSTEWVDIGERYDDYSSLWTETSVDLGAYAGETVQIAFFFHSDGSHEHPGWYIDDVSLVTGSYVFNNPEGWEDGIGDWYAETGLWELGTPSYGIDTAYSGQNCIATNLNGNYDYYADARFVSPSITLSAASENPRLRFWHWFQFQPADDDWGKVQIKESGSTEWIDVGVPFNDYSTVWTNAYIDLVPYAGKTVQIAFLFHSDGSHEHPGWYIDRVYLEDNSNLVVDAGSDFTITKGYGAALNATVSGGTQPYLIEWIPSDGLSDPTILNPEANPADTTTFTLKVIDSNGSLRTDKVTVFVDVDNNSATNVQSFSFPKPPQVGDAIVDQDSHSVSAEVENGTDLTSLIATFVLPDGASATVSGVEQISGATVNDFTNPVNYKVTAADGVTVQDWTVSVSVLLRIDDNSLGNVTIYPNPVPKGVTLRISNPGQPICKMVMYNIRGIKVMEISQIFTESLEVGADNLIKGAYIVELTCVDTVKRSVLMVQ